MNFRSGAICWQHELNKSITLTGKYFKYHFLPNIYEYFNEKDLELVIEATNEQKAQQAYELFISALTLLDGYQHYPPNDLPSVYTPEELKSDNRIYKNITQFSRSRILDAAKIAVKASFKRKHTYSIYKYLIACGHHSNYIMDLDPFQSDYEKLSKNPLDHLRYGYAILTFHSIIEELGLEIRASNKNPSKIKGEWNPSIKKDLEQRLTSSGIDINEKQLWNLRSKPTKIHTKDKLNLFGKAQWARYSIRDSEIEIIDAISYTSWLRSKVIAHKTNEMISSISIYDVANVNFFIRNILLTILKKNNCG